MKTKTLLLLCLFACFSAGTANAQAQRFVYSTSWHLESAWFACIDEPLTGDIEYNYSNAWMDGRNWLKIQERYKGTLTGDVSGDIYTLSEIVNNHQVNNFNNNGGGTGNWYWLSTMTIEKDGQPVAKMHYLTRGTCNSATWDKKDGNWDVWIERGWSECY